MSRQKTYNTKPTTLQFYRQYATYQSVLEFHPQNDMTVEEAYQKSILYIIDWFKDRVGKDQLDSIPEVSYINTQYPSIQDYKSFHIENAENISISTVLDVKSLYWQSHKNWSFRLIEPDNRTDQNEGLGRVFETNVAITQLETSVAMAVQLICKEPSGNTKDATIYRPAFVRQIMMDPDLQVVEYGVSQKYGAQPYNVPLKLWKTDKRKNRIANAKVVKSSGATNARFKKRLLAKPFFLNGKSNEECKALVNDLVENPNRKMPILFIPQKVYEKEATRVNSLTAQLLGYTHIVVIENSPWKLFKNVMNNDEYAQVVDEGEMILYRDSACFDIENPQTYYNFYIPEKGEKPVWSEIDHDCKLYPLRKPYHFEPCELYASAYEDWRLEQIKDSTGGCDVAELEEWKQRYKLLEVQLEEEKRDASVKQDENEEMKKELDSEKVRASSLHAAWRQAADELKTIKKEYDKQNKELERLRDKLRRTDSTELFDSKVNKQQTSSAQSEKEKFKPLLNFPKFDENPKSAIIDWIEEYYSDTLIMHRQAKSSFEKSNKKPDYELFCYMIHYLSGYTRHRNAGGKAIDVLAARDYDPLDKGLSVEPTSSGSSGATTMYADKYTINIHEYDEKQQNVIMDMHMKKGKGQDSNMIRIYFYYDSNIKKSIIGCMQDHLPTRKDAH